MTSNQILISSIEGILSSAIASQIIGVQPMTGPLSKIFTIRTIGTIEQSRIIMTKAHYRIFLRLNNRRKSQTEVDLAKANYPYCWINYQYKKECIDWCNCQFGMGGYIIGAGRFWFENPNDLSVFKLRWCE